MNGHLPANLTTSTVLWILQVVDLMYGSNSNYTVKLEECDSQKRKIEGRHSSIRFRSIYVVGQCACQNLNDRIVHSDEFVFQIWSPTDIAL